MSRVAHAQRHARPAAPWTQGPPASGVRCAEPGEEPLQRRAHERSTIPTARGPAVKGATDVYAQIVAGKLASVVASAVQRPRHLGGPRATTRDQFILVGSLDRIPVRTCSRAELITASIDHRQGFVLSLVDGATAIESIIDASPQAMHQVLSALTELLSLGLIGFRS